MDVSCPPCPALAVEQLVALAWHTAGSMRGPEALLQPLQEGLSEAGESLRSAVALTCQGRSENRALSPPHRCIQFLSVFITPSLHRACLESWGQESRRSGNLFFGINLECK